MASTNQSPFYKQAESKFLDAQTDDERIKWLEEMIRECPKHKSSEKMLANLKTRLKKLLQKHEKSKKSKKGKAGIKKEELQAVVLGYTQVGKSSLLSILTNSNPRISEIKFTTQNPQIGMMFFSGMQIQLIEIPAIESIYFEKGIAYTADVIIVLVNDIQQIEKCLKKIENFPAKKLIVFNRFGKSDERKISSYLSSKKYDFKIISTETNEGINELKEKIFKSFGKIRVFTKEPGKERTNRPLILEPESTVQVVAKKTIRGGTAYIKETKIWGPSSKFPGQIVGLQHKLKDMDIIEFKTR
jgi:uncharacterized protein